MASQLLGIKTRFTNDLGSPLVGGQVYTYFAGTSTNQDSYSDAALTVPNTNPVILDDTGSADIFLKGSYRIRVFDKSGRFIEEQDNVTQAASSLDATMLTERVNVIDSDLSKVKSDTGIAVVPKSGSLPITQAVKNAQTISMVEYGATGDGTSDDTAAFELLEANVTGQIIDLQDKVYVARYVPTGNVYRNGYFNIAGIIHPSELKPLDLKFKKHCMQFITGNRWDTNNPVIFSGSDNVFQDFCIVPQPSGNPKLYVTQRSYREDGIPAGANWEKYETYRIVEYDFKEDGSDVTANVFSQPLDIGHGAGLSYTVDDTGQLWFYSGYPSDSETDTSRSDKGFSRIKWLGATTSNNNVTYYQMFDYVGAANAIYSDLNKAFVKVSDDGKNLLLKASNTTTLAPQIHIYDLQAVLAAAVPKTVKPKTILKQDQLLGLITQGLTIHNNMLIGYYDVSYDTSAITVMDFNGNTLSHFEFETFKSLYSYAQLRGSMGVIDTLEGEGLCVFGNDIYIGYRDYWATIVNTVTYGGKYYAARQGSTGVVPTTPNYWMEIDAAYAVNTTEWSATTAYTTDFTNRTQVNKRIYKIGSVADSQTVAINSTNIAVDYPQKNVGVIRGGSVSYTAGVTRAIPHPVVKSNTVIKEYAGTNLTRTVSEDGETLLRSYNDKTPLVVDKSGTGDALTVSRNGLTYYSVNVSTLDTAIRTYRGNSLYLSTYTEDINSPLTAHTALHISGSRLSPRKFVAPTTNADVNLGEGANVFNNMYIQNAPIVSSDERLKQDFRSLKAAERKAAIEIKESICLYKMKDSVIEKGDGARWHVGVKAQQIVSIMEFHGLEPFDYGFICYDEWDALDAEIDEDGNEVQAEREAGDKYAVRYDELAMFILAAI